MEFWCGRPRPPTIRPAVPTIPTTNHGGAPGGPLAHGILTAAYISAAIGMHLPGPGTIYMSQSMRFMGPVRIGDTITARVEVISLNDEKQRVTLKTTCTNQEEKVVLDGEALVTLMKSD